MKPARGSNSRHLCPRRAACEFVARPAANFIAPFAIYEADNTAEKASLNAAMKRLKGPGAVTIISLDTNHYGSAFTQDSFVACK